MAISYARLEFVQRSNGKNACAKAAYNSRDKVVFDGTKFSEAKTYDWRNKERPAHHEIVLPKHADPSFKSMDKLWNLAEKAENRHNSQVAMEMVIALPDDQTISLEDRIELARRFADEVFVKHGLAVQIDIHQPEKKILLSPETGEVEHLDHNWHAHITSLTRRFKENGFELEKNKLRDFMPDVRNGRVCNGQSWGKLWTETQNKFFQEKGLDLRVDASGIIAQKHIGPVRLRGRAFSMEEENRQLESINRFESKEPGKILSKITETCSVFTTRDVDCFLNKHIELGELESVRDAFWRQQEIVPLLDKNTSIPTGKFSTQRVIEEENKILRLSDSVHKKLAFRIPHDTAYSCSGPLNQEQKRAYDQILNGNRLSCIEGHAGTGKSYLLSSLANAYQSDGYTVRSLGPDNATAGVLRDKGLPRCGNVHQFLFSVEKNRVSIAKGKEVWIIDESSKLGNRPLLELLKLSEKHNAQIIFSGCSSQMSSVDRGGMFTTFCSRYGSVELSEIQRQKDVEQRLMAQSLATGEMGVAMERLAGLNGINWCDTRGEAFEKLVKTWAAESTLHPYDSSLILAHSNSEVRILNEMARLYRREKGEIDAAEYACKTTNGKIIVSVGDRIEFRKNDKELAVTNGMTGVLVEASTNRFVVSVKQKEGERQISFDPDQFRNFQLGYATTYFRSQGQTVDRAYVLHSPQMNKEKFYVGLTRHVHEAKIFVSREEASCIADLKRQAFRHEEKDQTLSYTSPDQLERERIASERVAYLDQLKASASTLTRFKGRILGAWDSFKGELSSRATRASDLVPNRDFFDPTFQKEDALVGAVVCLDDRQKEGVREFFRENIDSARHEPSAQVKPSGIKPLDSDARHRVDAYIRSSRESSDLYAIVKAEAAEQDLKFAAHFKQWQISCGLRNEQAHRLLGSCDHQSLRNALGERFFETALERSEKHEMALKKQSDHKIDLSANLREQIEPLLHRLFPDGPTGRDARGLRFGSKGSIAVVCAGEKKGSFYDFESGEGGGPLKLIERALNYDRSEAKAWATEFLGAPRMEFVPSQFRVRGSSKTKYADWKSLKPDPSHPAPSLRELSASLHQRYTEYARHDYRNEQGELLFHTLRLVDQLDPKKKIFLPLSYGQSEGSFNPSWAIKTYQSDQRTLYRLEQIYKNPSATILVVEGEKTADAAQCLFKDENVVCITWQGGASSVSKTDWTPLYGKNVVIWPDNDQAGFKASENLCTQLRKVGVESLKVVSEKMLEKFPEKWDLADPAPPGKNLYDMVLMANHKTVGISQNSFSGDVVDCLHAQQVLFHVEERLWSSLEQKHAGNTIEVQREIQREVHRLLADQVRVSQSLQSDRHMSQDLADRLSRQIALSSASNGTPPSSGKIEDLKSAITKSMPSKDSLETYVSDTSLSEAISRSHDKSLSHLAFAKVSEKSTFVLAAPIHHAEKDQSLSFGR